MISFEMKQCWKLCSTLVFVALSANAHAQAASIDRVLREALTTNPNVKAARGGVQAAGHELDGAKWARFPTLSTEVQTQTGSPQTTARVEQPLWTGGRITGQINAADAKKVIAEADLSKAEMDVLQQTANAFFEVIRHEARLRIATDNENEHERLLNAIRRRVEAEVSPQTDETQAAARKYQATNERLSAQRQVADARSTLLQLVGRPVGALAFPVRVNLKERDDDSLLEAARAFSPQRRRLEAQLASAEADIELARAQLMPRLVAGYQHHFNDTPLQTNDNRAYVALQYQTGAGLSSLAAIEATMARKYSALDALEAYDRQLAQQVRSTWAEVLALSQQLSPVRNLQADSRSLVESYLRQFQVGRKSWLDVLNAQREKAQAEYNLADIEAPLLSAKVRLLALAGDLTPNTLEQLHD